MTVKTQYAFVKRGDGASPEIFTTVASCTGFTGPNGSRTVNDVTTLASTGKEFVSGMADYGNVSLNLLWDSDDAYNVSLWDDFVGGSSGNWQIGFDDSPQDVITFAGVVISFSFDASDPDAVVRATAEIKITGTPTDNF